MASESSQWWKSMASVVIFGLLLATILTLVIVPVLFESIENTKVGMALQYQNIRAFFLGVKQTDLNG
jgi:hypothetical protein